MRSEHACELEDGVKDIVCQSRVAAPAYNQEVGGGMDEEERDASVAE